MPEPTPLIRNAVPGQLGGGSAPPPDANFAGRLANVEAQLNAVLPTLATKSDLEKSGNDTVKWLVGTMLTGLGLMIVIMTFVMNNAVPKAAKDPASIQPIVVPIQLAPANSPPAAQPAKTASTKP